MTPQQWIDDVQGKPWVDRAYGPESFDCWGLVIDYFYRVHGVTIPEVTGYKNGDCSIAAGFKEQIDSGLWCVDEHGIVFTEFHGDMPKHVGVIIGDRVIHAYGHKGRGQVHNHSFRQFKRLFKKVERYTYVGI